MRKIATGLVAFVPLIVVVVAWLWASPYFAVAGLRNAALRGDAMELDRRVDFPRLRESIKTQVSTLMLATMAEDLRDNPFAALGLALATKLTDVMIETMVSPAGLLALVEGKKDSAPEVSGLGLMLSNEAAIDRDGLGTFEFQSAKEQGSLPTLRFNRDGLDWRLVAIQLPKDYLLARKGNAPQAGRAAAPYVPKWDLEERKDPMDDSVSVFFYRDADEEVSARYSKVRPTLVFKCEKKRLEAYVNFRSRVDYDYQTHRSAARLRFDDGEAKRENWIASVDGEALFAPIPTLFLRAFRDSAVLLFEWRQSNENTAIAKFTTGDLEAHVGRFADACGVPPL